MFHFLKCDHFHQWWMDRKKDGSYWLLWWIFCSKSYKCSNSFSFIDQSSSNPNLTSGVIAWMLWSRTLAIILLGKHSRHINFLPGFQFVSEQKKKKLNILWDNAFNFLFLLCMKLVGRRRLRKPNECFWSLKFWCINERKRVYCFTFSCPVPTYFLLEYSITSWPGH